MAHRSTFARISAIGLFATMISPTSALANATRVTRGDAEAVFQAGFNGGWAMELHNDGSEGAPAGFLSTDLVRIHAEPALFEGKHYCALDWHVVATFVNEGNRPGQSFTVQEIFDKLAARIPTFKLDGVLVGTERTAPKRMLNPESRGFTEAFFVSVGRVMAPDEISIGTHSLQLFNAAGNQVGKITFYIDAPGTGVCVPPADDALTFREVSP